MVDYVCVVDFFIAFIELSESIPQFGQFTERLLALDSSKSFGVCLNRAFDLPLTQLDPIEPLVHIVWVLAQDYV